MEARHYKWVIFTGLATTCFGVYAAVNPRTNASDGLKRANYLELATQTIELLAYCFIWHKAIHSIADSSTGREILRARYYDWVVTTFIMMWTTRAIISELNTLDKLEFEDGRSPWTFVQKVNLPIVLMLLMGYVTETERFHNSRYKWVKSWAKWPVLFFGVICLWVAFTHLLYLTDDHRSRVYVEATMTLWALYGLCFIAGNDAQKNIGYTLLDVVSKNINGIYIASLLI